MSQPYSSDKTADLGFDDVMARREARLENDSIASSPMRHTTLPQEGYITNLILLIFLFLTVIPSERQGLHLDPPVFQTALKWWLGLDTAEGSHCALCPDKMLDPLGHHATTCGDVVFCHNKLRDILAETCRRAHFSVQVEAGCNLTSDHNHSRPADVLISN